MSSALIQFSVPGIPVPKGRPRIQPGGRGRPYTPAKTKKAEKAVAQCARLIVRPRELIQGAIMLCLRFRLPDRRRVDLDNLEKLVKDSLNGVLWKDDSQITACIKTKTLSDEPGTDVAIIPLRDENAHDAILAMSESVLELVMQSVSQIKMHD